MRRLATLAVVAALMSPTTASGQDYSFGDWARDEGYSPGDVMPETVKVFFPLWEPGPVSGIDSLDGIGEFDWTTTPTTQLWLHDNQISSIEPGDFDGLATLWGLYLNRNLLSSIESGDFSGLATLTGLQLWGNQISSIESGAFSGLANLTWLALWDNHLSSIESGDFSGLTNLRDLGLRGNQISSIESNDFNGLTNLTELGLGGNQLSSIESGAFSGLTNLAKLSLSENPISSIESGAFSGLATLERLGLSDCIALTELNLEAADFSALTEFSAVGNVNITSVSLRNTVLNQTSLARLLDGGDGCTPFVCWQNTGIGELDATITEMDLSGIDFVDITDLSVFYSCPSDWCEPGYGMNDLTDLWLVDTQNVDATDLDVLLDNLETIEDTDTEGVLYMTEADFDAFNTDGGGLLAVWDAEPGHHVAFVIPEPSTLLLALIALGVVGGWRKWAA